MRTRTCTLSVFRFFLQADIMRSVLGSLRGVRSSRRKSRAEVPAGKAFKGRNKFYVCYLHGIWPMIEMMIAFLHMWYVFEFLLIFGEMPKKVDE